MNEHTSTNPGWVVDMTDEINDSSLRERLDDIAERIHNHLIYRKFISNKSRSFLASIEKEINSLADKIFEEEKP